MAYGAYDRYVRTPYRGGAFRPGAANRAAAMTKAAATARFAADQLRRAGDNAAADAALCPLAVPLQAAVGAVTDVADGLERDAVDPADLTAVDDLLARIGRDSVRSGVKIELR